MSKSRSFDTAIKETEKKKSEATELLRQCRVAIGFLVDQSGKEYDYAIAGLEYAVEQLIYRVELLEANRLFYIEEKRLRG